MYRIPHGIPGGIRGQGEVLSRGLITLIAKKLAGQNQKRWIAASIKGGWVDDTTITPIGQTAREGGLASLAKVRDASKKARIVGRL